jgi:DNA-binding response OmpR family regulator
MTCILVVEDESDIREMLVEVLRDEGFQIIEAATADAAVELLNLAGLGLVVTDINLPGRRDGIDLALAARRVHPGIPVVFMSGKPTKLAQAHTLSDPAAFLQKPFSFRTLVGAVERLSDVCLISPTPR